MQPIQLNKFDKKNRSWIPPNLLSLLPLGSLSNMGNHKAKLIGICFLACPSHNIHQGQAMNMDVVFRTWSKYLDRRPSTTNMNHGLDLTWNAKIIIIYQKSPQEQIHLGNDGTDSHLLIQAWQMYGNLHISEGSSSPWGLVQSLY